MGQPNLKDILKPGAPLPDDDTMVEKALDIMSHSATGKKLADFARAEEIEIRLLSTPEALTYLPSPRVACIGFNRQRPITPTHFVLLLTSVLREAEQENAGLMHPPLEASLEEHEKTSMAKFEDQVWHMCAVAAELNDLPAFTEYKFLDELRKIGHDESIELFLKQERSGDKGHGSQGNSRP